MALDDTCFDAAHALVDGIYAYNERYNSHELALVIEALFPLCTITSMHATPLGLTPNQISLDTKISVLSIICNEKRDADSFKKILPMLTELAATNSLFKDAVDTFNDYIKTDDGLMYMMRNFALVGNISKI